MSMTLSVGVAGPGKWAYMAKELAGFIDQIISSRRIEADSLPESMFADADEFFQLLSQYVQGGVPQNPPASANAYFVASKAMKTSKATNVRENIKGSLKTYVEFFKRIREPRALGEEDVRIATDLKNFLYLLYRDGQAENYEARVRFEPDRS